MLRGTSIAAGLFLILLQAAPTWAQGPARWWERSPIPPAPFCPRRDGHGREFGHFLHFQNGNLGNWFLLCAVSGAWRLPPTVEAPGLKRSLREGILVSAGGVPRIDVKLEVGADGGERDRLGSVTAAGNGNVRLGSGFLGRPTH